MERILKKEKVNKEMNKKIEILENLKNKFLVNISLIV